MNSKIRLGIEEIKYINLFESYTGAKVVDCIQEGSTLGFVVEKGDMGLAIGRNGSNIERIRKVLGKTVVAVESSEKPAEFVRNLFKPVKLSKIELNGDGGVGNAIIEVRRSDRSRVIGQDGTKIKIAKKLIQRHHNIGDITIKTVR